MLKLHSLKALLNAFTKKEKKTLWKAFFIID